jgi:hypothetical protein
MRSRRASSARTRASIRSVFAAKGARPLTLTASAISTSLRLRVTDEDEVEAGSATGSGSWDQANRRPGDEELVEAARVRQVGEDGVVVEGDPDVEPGAALEEGAGHRRPEPDVVHGHRNSTTGGRGTW